MNRTTDHIGPRCSYCGCAPEGEHSRRCAVTKHGSDPMWGEWADDIKRERDALRTRVAELEAALVGELCGDLTCARCDKFRAVLKSSTARRLYLGTDRPDLSELGGMEIGDEDPIEVKGQQT